MDVDIYNASINVLFEGSVVGAVSFETLQLREHGATRTVRLVTSSLWVFSTSPLLLSFTRRSKGIDRH